MFCKSCGSNVDDGAEFCPVCGAKMNSEAAPAMAVVEEEAKASGKKCMIWGIVAAVLAEFGLIGIIFSIIAKSKVKKHINAGYPMNGMAKAGKICATVALPVSIVMTLIWALYIVIFAIAIFAGAGEFAETSESIFEAALKSGL